MSDANAPVAEEAAGTPTPVQKDPTPATVATTTPTTNTFGLALVVVVTDEMANLTTKGTLRAPVRQRLLGGLELVRESGDLSMEFEDVHFADASRSVRAAQKILNEAQVWDFTNATGPINGMAGQLVAFVETQLPDILKAISNDFGDTDINGGEYVGMVVVETVTGFGSFFSTMIDRQLVAGDALRCWLEIDAKEPTAPSSEEDESHWTSRSVFTVRLLKAAHVQNGTTWTPEGGIQQTPFDEEGEDDPEEEGKQ